MKQSHSEVSIDQVAQLAGQAGAYQHENTREFDRAVLRSAANDALTATSLSPARRLLRLVKKILRN